MIIATVEVSEDQQSLAIGRGGQNVRLAAKLTGWSIDIRPMGGASGAGGTDDKIDPAFEPEDPVEKAVEKPEEGFVGKEGAEEAELEAAEGPIQPPFEETTAEKEEGIAIEEAPQEFSEEKADE